MKFSNIHFFQSPEDLSEKDFEAKRPLKKRKRSEDEGKRKRKKVERTETKKKRKRRRKSELELIEKRVGFLCPYCPKVDNPNNDEYLVRIYATRKSNKSFGDNPEGVLQGWNHNHRISNFRVNKEREVKN